MPITPSGAIVWRDYVTDGVPASGAHKVDKASVRAWSQSVEDLVTAAATAALVFDTRANLYATLTAAANTLAWVVADSTAAYNGIYRKSGASGTGSWSRVADLPYSFVKMSDAGAGTANAIQVTSDIPTSDSVLRISNVFEANTGNVTISENGGTAKALLTSSGNQIASGGLVAGMMISYFDDGASFRLISDQASAAIQAAAEAAQAAAEDARDDALAAVASVDLPVIGSGDGGKALIVKDDLSGYEFGFTSNTVTPEAYGAAGNGTTDDTVAVQAALNAGIVALTPGASYLITQSLVVPNGGGILGDGTARFIMDSTGFNHTSELLATRFGTNAVGIIVKGGLTSPFTQHTGAILKDFILESEVLDGRVLKGIAVLNARNVVISGVEIFGLPVGTAICFNSVVNSVAVHNYIHDCTTNVTGFTLPQITGIEVDNDLVNNVISSNLKINFNTIKNLTVGAATLAEDGYQTDGINIARELSYGHQVIGNYIEGVGEGIDTFGDSVNISHNTIKNAYIFGIKLIHGARRTRVVSNMIDGAGLCGIALEGSSTAANDTERNLISSNTIERVNYNGAWNANDTAGIRTNDNGGTTILPRNNMVVDNYINCNGTGKYGIYAAGNGTLNLFRDNRVVSATTRETFGAIADIRSADKAGVRGAFNTTTAAQNTVDNLGSTPTLDVQEEWSSATYTAKAHRLLKVYAQIRTSVASSYEIRCFIRKNGSAVATGTETSSGGSQTTQVQDLISVAPGDTISFAWLHTDPTNRAVTADATLSFFTISEEG
ncbi:right-handed parallel beta-helix repeat-containing protein [Rhizobium cremeum]|uniref:right-handed parallel beta-helix repeat-containing protein n=1 Tax=Rhizobium cremeum TaxID=2813827 RepID=UPI001FD34FD8|nr:right-handed parallel beta-helix repeat-containing protein [Rhizobium cremeum]MCJ7995902.1 right-handed parallel beta-helix repeat-containing protein [Rhizobium cremeum]MCJ7999657.1 right-handed parallel beta-helix repeat-containing protein [Rhizobium cremeum]